MSHHRRPAPAPPKLLPKPGQVKVYRAMYNYTAQTRDELSFEEGETLYVSDSSNPHWWKARVGARSGLIPSNYVEENTASVDNPLHEAAKRGNFEFLKECLLNKVSVNSLDKSGSPALYWAAHGGHIDCVEALLASAGCQVNVKNKLGDTPLHAAAWKSHPDVVEQLLATGADAMILNGEGKKAFELAKDPTTASILKRRSQFISNRGSSCDDEDYGDELDSD